MTTSSTDSRGHGVSRFVACLTAPGKRPLLLPLCAVGLALLICFAAIWMTGKDPVAGYQRMFMGGLGNLRALGDSSMKAAILALTGLSVAIAFATGLFNIGGEGQLVCGAIAAAFVGQAVHPGTAWVHVPLALLAAAVAGALPALLAAWLKVRRGVHEVISTIMLNWTAIYLVEGWLVTGPLRATSATGNSLPGTAQIDATAELPRFFGMRSDLGVGLLVAVAMALFAWVMLRKTWLGFEMRASGDSADTARTSGLPVERRVYLSMAISGACAGLAGAIIILGIHRQYPATFRTGYGFDGVAVSLIGGNHPLGILVAAAFFGVIRAGGASLQLLQIHRTFPELIQGLALLFIAGRAILECAMEKVHAKASAMSAATVPPPYGPDDGSKPILERGVDGTGSARDASGSVDAPSEAVASLAPAGSPSPDAAAPSAPSSPAAN